MMFTRSMPKTVQNLADEIMNGRRGFAPGYSMSLDPNPAPEPEQQQIVGQGETFFTKDDIDAAVEKARKQEKDKLYGKVTNLETQLSEFSQREQEKVAAEQRAREEAEAARRAAEEENLSAKELLARKEQEWQERLNTTQQSLEERLAQIQKDRENEQALLEKERQFASLQTYKNKRLTEETETIAPQFHDFIAGNTQDEIEQSIAIAKAKSAEVAEQVQQALQAARQQQRGVGISGYAPVGPLEFEAGQRQVSASDIANMDMAEYAKHRQQLIGAGPSSNRGLFG